MTFREYPNILLAGWFSLASLCVQGCSIQLFPRCSCCFLAWQRALSLEPWALIKICWFLWLSLGSIWWWFTFGKGWGVLFEYVTLKTNKQTKNIEECKTGLKEQVPEVVEIGAAEFLVGLGKGGKLAELWTKQVPNLCLPRAQTLLCPQKRCQLHRGTGVLPTWASVKLPTAFPRRNCLLRACSVDKKPGWARRAEVSSRAQDWS